VNTVAAALPQLLHGLAVTVAVACAGMAIAVVTGFVLGVLRAHAPAAVDLPVLGCIELIRGIPLLVLMYLVFFGLPQLGVHTSSFGAAIAALGAYAGALASEIVRGAIVSIPRGQSEAAASLGLGTFASLRLVVLPQAIRRMLPPFVALFALVVESSSLSALIDVPDLLQAARSFSEAHAGSAFALYLAVLVLYFVINEPVSLAAQRLERALV
jgi:polar amino acid transport system permease protein